MGGNDFLNNLLVHQNVGRGIDSFHHKEPFYYYLISIWFIIEAWSILVIGLFITGLIKKGIYSTNEQFFAEIIISTFILLSLISSKLSIYSLHFVPIFIYMTVLLFKKVD